MKLSTAQLIALEAAMDRMGLPTVQQVIDGEVDFGTMSITIIGVRDGQALAAFVQDASSVEWHRLRPNWRITAGRLPPELLAPEES